MGGGEGQLDSGTRLSLSSQHRWKRGSHAEWGPVFKVLGLLFQLESQPHFYSWVSCGIPYPSPKSSALVGNLKPGS